MKEPSNNAFRQALSIDYIFLATLVLAALLRMVKPGLLNTWIDELNIIGASIRLARYGDWTWLGNETTFFFISAHSPLPTYLSALPALIFPHPDALRLFYGLVGLVVVALIYWMMNRLIGRTAARSSALLVAVMPLAIYWSRFVWNPNLAPLFLVPWLYTAVIGYGDEDKPWAQYLHWLCLGFAIQSQTALLVITPISLLLLLYNFWQSFPSPRDYILRHVKIFIVLAITLLPWLWGIYGETQGWWGVALGAGNFDDGNLALDIPSSSEVTYMFSLLTASVGYRQQSLLISDNPAGWWFPPELHRLLYLQTIIIFLGAIIITAWQYYYKTEKRELALILTLSLFWSLILFFFNRLASDFYMMLTLYAGVCIFGWVSQLLSQRSRWLIVIPMILTIAQLWLSLSILSWYQRDSDVASYSEIIDNVEAWAENDQSVLIWENEPSVNRLEQREWLLHWQILSESHPLRYTTYPLSLPLTDGEALVVGNLEDIWLHDWLIEQEPTQHTKRDFPTYYADIEQFPSINYRSTTQQSFADMANIRGLYAIPPTDERETWVVFIYWQPLQTTTQTWQFSLRLMNGEDTLAQTDQLSLEPELWRADEEVISFMTLAPNANLNSNADLHLDLVMYSYPENEVLSVIAQETQEQIGQIISFYPIQP